MQLAPSALRSIDLAAHLAAETYQYILKGSAVPLTLGGIHANGQPVLEHPDGPLQAVRAGLHAAGSAGAQVLLFEMAARFDDSAAEHGLFVEFGTRAGTLHGLLLALPYVMRHDGKRIPGMIQVRRCPDRLRYQVDELLPRFFRALQTSPGGSAWLRALEYDRLAAPSLEAFEATRRAVDACCPALRQDDPASDCNAVAYRHLDALVERYPLEHGIRYRKALYQLGLDFTADSLLRIDYLLEQLKPRLGVSEAQFTASAANLNFLHTLAFYLGTVVAQASGAHIDWYTASQLRQVLGEDPDSAATPATSLAGVFNNTPSAQFFPLALLLERLFGSCSSADFRARLKAVGRRAASVRTHRLQDEMAEVQRRIDHVRGAEPRYLQTERPYWADGDSIDLWFQNVDALFQGGRLVWGCVTQANSIMWQAGSGNAPGEVLYDLRGIPGGPQLAPVARAVYEYKCTRPLDHRLGFLADHLTHEMGRAYGLPVPLRLSGADLRLTTIFFDRKHLPGRQLHSGMLPLLIHDAYPGIVTVLPERFWTEEIATQCRQYGWPV